MIFLADNPFGWFAPNIGNLPGGGTFQTLTNGLGGFVLVALVFGLLLASASWALGLATGNIQLAERGKQGVVAAILIALRVGASGILLGFFFAAGQGLHGA
jgi:hypothetical protein